VSQVVSEAFANYINSISVGMPINTFTLQKLFLESVSSIVDSSLISALSISVKIDGVVVAPSVGTGLIYGDGEGYVVSDVGKMTITRV
jgi:hypothetical protein